MRSRSAIISSSRCVMMILTLRGIAVSSSAQRAVTMPVEEDAKLHTFNLNDSWAPPSSIPVDNESG